MATPIIPTEAPRQRRRGIPIFRPNVNSLAFQPIVNIPDEGESNLWQPQPKPTSSNLRIYTGPVVFSFNSKNPRKQKTTGKTKKYATKKRKVVKKRS
jgi:hypothetical protein